MAKTVKIGVDLDTGKAVSNAKNLKKQVKGVGDSAADTKGGFNKMKAGVNGLGVAFKAVGIGLIVALFVKLKGVFSGNIETARKFEKISSQLGAAFDVVRDAVEPLFMSLGKLFTDPLGSLKKFAEAIKENLINRVKGLIDTFGALGKVVEGVLTRDLGLIKEGANDVKTAFIQMNTGLDEEQQKRIADGFKKIGNEIINEASAMGKLTVQLQKVRDEEREMTLIRSKANQLIAKSRLLAEDDTKSMEERLAALKEAISEEQRVASMEEATQKKKVDALQSIIDLGKSSEEDMQKLADERARLIDIQTASMLKQKRVITEVNTFEKQIETERKKRVSDKKKEGEKEEKRLQAEKNIKSKELETFRVALLSKEQIEIEAAQSKFDKLKEIAVSNNLDMTVLNENFEKQKLSIKEKYAKKDDNIVKISQDKKVQIINQTMSAISGLLKKDSKAAKGIAVAQAIMNTWQGVTSALAMKPSGPWNFVQAGAVMLSGMGAVRNIMTTDAGGETGGGGGGIDGQTGPTPATNTGGLVGALQQQMIPSQLSEQLTAGAQQPIQAYVVENDISSAQALTEEVELQTSL